MHDSGLQLHKRLLKKEREWSVVIRNNEFNCSTKLELFVRKNLVK